MLASGELDDSRRTRAFTKHGNVHLLEDAWRQHGKGAERIMRIACQDKNVDPLAFDVENTKCVGYSWSRDEQYAGTEDIPYFESMLSRPPEMNGTGQKQCHKRSWLTTLRS